MSVNLKWQIIFQSLIAKELEHQFISCKFLIIAASLSIIKKHDYHLFLLDVAGLILLVWESKRESLY